MGRPYERVAAMPLPSRATGFQPVPGHGQNGHGTAKGHAVACPNERVARRVGDYAESFSPAQCFNSATTGCGSFHPRRLSFMMPARSLRVWHAGVGGNTEAPSVKGEWPPSRAHSSAAIAPILAAANCLAKATRVRRGRKSYMISCPTFTCFHADSLRSSHF
jgi:hypothetical protein